MCQSQQEGGKRCAGIAKKNSLRRNKHAVEEWGARIERAKSAGEPSFIVGVYEERQREAQLKVDTLQTELAVIDARHKAERQPRPTKYQGGSTAVTTLVSEEDQRFIEAEARRRGLSSASALINAVVEEEPQFLPARTQVELATRTTTDNTNGGRPPADASKRRDRRLKTRCTNEVKKSLTEEAAMFHLTVADYLIHLLLGKDPRVRGGHISATNAQKGADAMRSREEAAGVRNGEEAAAFWQQKIRDTRRSHGLVA